MTVRIRSISSVAVALAVVAISVWATSAWRVDALPGPTESTVVNVAPERVMDTRDPVNLGLPGPFMSQVSQKLQIAGSIPTATGIKTVVPAGATGVLLNVTGFNPSANGFISIRPGDAAGAPTTSSLNVLAGQTVPNAVQVSLPTTGANAGQIDITYDALGQTGPFTDMFIDVVGYTANTGLQDVNAELGKKANAADVHTKTEADARYVPQQGEIVMNHSPYYDAFDPLPPPSILHSGNASTVSGGLGTVLLQLHGPSKLGATEYGLKSIQYCISARTAPAFVTRIEVLGVRQDGSVNGVDDNTDRTATGCHTLTTNIGDATSYAFTVGLAGGAGSVGLGAVTTTWAPKSTLTP